MAVVVFVVLLLNLQRWLGGSGGAIPGTGAGPHHPGVSGVALQSLAMLVGGALWPCPGLCRGAPSRGETSRLLRRGILASLLGLVLGSVGYQALAGSLFVQASLQAPGFFGGPVGTGVGRGGLVNYPITSIEMLSVLSNTQVLTAHLVGLVIGLWLLRRIH